MHGASRTDGALRECESADSDDDAVLLFGTQPSAESDGQTPLPEARVCTAPRASTSTEDSTSASAVLPFQDHTQAPIEDAVELTEEEQEALSTPSHSPNGSFTKSRRSSRSSSVEQLPLVESITRTIAEGGVAYNDRRRPGSVGNNDYGGTMAFTACTCSSP